MNSAFPRADWLSWMRIVEYYSPPRSHREKHGSLVAMVCQEEIIKRDDTTLIKKKKLNLYENSHQLDFSFVSCSGRFLL